MAVKLVTHKVSLYILVTTICSVLLTFIALQKTQGVTQWLLALLFSIVIISQFLLLKSHLRQQQRLAKYHNVGRKLVHNRAEMKRDENHAAKILNHINSVSDQSPTHACIWQKPLHRFSGDLVLACEGKFGRKYTLLADLTGHGIAAAMGAAPVASIFQATAKRGLSVEEIVTELNNRLLHLLPSGFFCCATVVMVDQGTATVCNAGVPDILITNSDGAIVDQVSSEQLPLGIQAIEARDVQVFTKSYSVPHQLYAITDGLIETVGANDEVFDMDRLIALIKSENRGAGRIGNIADSFERFTKDSTVSDDISIVEVMIC